MTPAADVQDDMHSDESGETQPLQGQQSSDPPPTRSHYALTRQEITRGIANRFVHSRTYIFLYLGMAALSITTIVLSLTNGCPGLAFYILEIIINTTMIAEVAIRLVAFGKQFWKSPFNVMDLVLTAFCCLTLLVIAFAGCGSTSKKEEILDTLLLVARNVLQFTRLAAVMRQSGQSIFSRPKPIDLSTARLGGHSLDFDVVDEEEHWSRSSTRNQTVFDTLDSQERGDAGLSPSRAVPVETLFDHDDEQVWRS